MRLRLYATEDNDARYVDEPGMRELASCLMELPQGWADCEAVRRQGTDGYPIQVCGPLRSRYRNRRACQACCGSYVL